ncbi:MAG: (Dimethylallyl)adenosine tRNA methylthiotransferase MiaB [Microgenomates bacterium OLB22]|nr:MAG: (Dimethylallyl)adenosine tRNA methylthiotransferase MiaB [Microgenomates bacterium OLB22]
MVKQQAEHRVYSLVHNLGERKRQGEALKIVVTGCMIGAAARDKTGHYLRLLRDRMPEVDEFMPIEEIGFDHAPLRTSHREAWVPISNGCNNFCTFCIVPFTRGREISRPYNEILEECIDLLQKGYTKVTLLGQNVNSYGADLLLGAENIQVLRDIPGSDYFTKQKRSIKELPTRYKPTMVKHLGKLRIPTLFPQLLRDVAQLRFEQVDFLSSNPWDFSDDLIKTIAQNKNISRVIHLPLQSGDDDVLRKMNRWYTTEEYFDLVNKLRRYVPDVTLTTDIIVGFPDETEDQYQNTYKFCEKVKYRKAYISQYSPRPFTAASKMLQDTVDHATKERRWKSLDTLINKPSLRSMAGIHKAI